MLAELTARPAPRLSGQCCDCRAYGPTDRVDHHGHRIMWCATHDEPVRAKGPPCNAFDRSPRSISRSHAKQPRLLEPASVVAIVPERCDHCGSTTLYRDPDGWGCPQCGWHLYTTASERTFGERPVGDALPALVGIMARGW